MFVFPTCWNTYRDLLINVLLEDSKSSKKLRCQIEKFIEVVRARNEIFDENKGDTFGRKNLKDKQLLTIQHKKYTTDNNCYLLFL